MFNKNILLMFLCLVLLNGCMGPHASFSEGLQDNFLGTSATNIPATERHCIRLTKPYTFQSGSLTFSLPAGRYMATKKNNTGYFYYAPGKITSSNWFMSPPQQGIYLDNHFNKGNLFGINTQGFDDRPIRNAILPNDIFAYIQRNTSC